MGSTFFSFRGNRAAKEKELHISVIADLHYYPPSFFSDSSAAYQDYLAKDPKMLRESAAALEASLQLVEQQHSEILLIPGDLTKDAEKQGHLEVVAHLREFYRRTGIQPLVIPGNHDVYNDRGAVSFATGCAVPVETVTAAEFRALYREFGYGKAKEHFLPRAGQEAGGLSYLYEINSEFSLLALDTCKYSPDVNGKGTHQSITGGALSEDLLAWAVQKIKEEQARGRTVLAMAHHGIVPHFSMQPVLAKDFLVDQWETVADRLTEAGLRYVFTGHMHANDIARWTSPSGKVLHDIQTAAPISYGSFVRDVKIEKKHSPFTGMTSESLRAQGDFLRTVEQGAFSFPDYQQYMKEALYSREVLDRLFWRFGVLPLLESMQQGGLRGLLRYLHPKESPEAVLDRVFRAAFQDGVELSVRRLGHVHLLYREGKLLIKPRGLARVAGKQRLCMEQIMTRWDAPIAQWAAEQLKDPRALRQVFDDWVTAVLDFPLNDAQGHCLYDFGMEIFLSYYRGASHPASWVCEGLDALRSGVLLRGLAASMIPMVGEGLERLTQTLRLPLRGCFRGVMNLALRSLTRGGQVSRILRLLRLRRRGGKAWLRPANLAKWGEQAYQYAASFAYDDSPDGTLAPYFYETVWQEDAEWSWCAPSLSSAHAEG